MEAQHIHYPDGGKSAGEEFGTLVGDRPNQKTAITAAKNRQMFGGREFLLNEIFGGGDEVIENVLFLQSHAGFVPLFAVLVSAPQVGDGVNSAFFHPCQPTDAKARRQRNREAAVTIQDSRIFAVTFQPFFVNQKQRDAGSVLTGDKNLLCDKSFG